MSRKNKKYEFRTRAGHVSILTSEQIADRAKSDVETIVELIKGQKKRATKTMVRILIHHINRLDRVARDV